MLVGCLHKPMMKEKQDVQAENCTHPDHRFLLGTSITLSHDTKNYNTHNWGGKSTDLLKP